ncbi:MAG: hypothetical protein WCA31_04810 [Acidimicrobiales bacterium]
MRQLRSLRRGLRFAAALSMCAAIAGVAMQAPARGSSAAPTTTLVPGNLLVATSTYQNDSGIVVGTQLPPGCGSDAYDPCGTAVANGSYPYVFNLDPPSA